MNAKWRSNTILCVAVVAVLALWFSAAAVIPALAAEYELDNLTKSLFISSVQAGFVVGSLASAVLGLADRLDPRRFFMTSALVAAAANGAMLTVEPTSFWIVPLRFVTGACMAGVYPVGMKIAATWARPGRHSDMGLLVGLLVGAVTLGSATPHLFNALTGIDWRLTLAAASLSALAGGVAILAADLGPNVQAAPRFKPAEVFAAWKIKSLRLANLGYLGHMWELYAMWAWIGLFLHGSFAQSLDTATAGVAAKVATFATVGIGALGSLAGGLFADRLGRTTLTMLAMAVSGSCAATIGFLYGASPWLVVPVCLVWGISVIADSAQFSASVGELAERHLVGTMLTVQTAAGFALTLVTIHLMPFWIDSLGWRWAFAPLAVGPFLGVWAMARLRAHPDVVRLAGGRR